MNKTMAVILVLLLACSTQSQAQSVLTKELITSFQQVSQQWQTLERDYPELTAQVDNIDISQVDKMIAQLKNSSAYPKIQSIIASSNFSSLDEYYDIAMRLMAGMMMQKMPQGMNADSMGEMLKSSIAQMKANNAPSAVITQMEQQLIEMEKNIKVVQSALKNLSAADKKFINENAQWIMSVLDEQR